ncbi:MAG: carboxypeptidase regulatory-like domain-containing protein [Blastocatellales bacterium]
MLHHRLRRAFCLAIFLAFCSLTCLAQSAVISGTVTDPRGGAVAGATVTVTNKASGANRAVTTTAEGVYQIPQLAPGTYTLRAEAAGFKAVVRNDVEALVNTPLTLNLAFTDVGAVTESVTVTGGESTLNTSDATIGNTFNSTKVVELPLSARNVPDLLSLQTGVTPRTGGTTDNDRGGHVNGARSDQSNVTLDGVDVNEQQLGTAFFSVLRLTPDSLQEFRVTTTNANADQGRSSGAQVSLVTKSGTNQFHGSLYEYHRNTATSANDWFNNKDGVERPALIRNNFGGSIGGPIKKDRLFFFFNYEGFREAKGQSVIQEVPLPTLGQGIVRYHTEDGASDPSCPSGTPAGVRCLTRAQISQFYNAANGFDPGTNSAALAALAAAASRYPANSSAVGDGLNTAGFRFNAGAPVRQNTYILKLDANLTSKQTLFARFNYQNDVATGVRWLPDTTAPQQWVHPKGVALGHSWTISNSLVNNFRYGLTRDAFTLGGDSDQNQILFRFIFEPFEFTRALSRTTPIHNFTNDLSWVKGTHSMQFGTNVRLIRNNRLSFGSTFDSAITNPSYYQESGAVVLFGETSGDPIFPNVSAKSEVDLRDALTAVIGRYSQYGFNLNYGSDGKLLPAGSGVKRTFATEEYDFYGQDSWRARSNLTLTYGLRWSTSTPVYEANGLQVKPTSSLSDFFARRVAGAESGKPYNELITLDLAGKANGKGGYYPQDWNNFAPAVAVAWSPNFQNGFLKTVFGENKTTLRGGFRMTYDRVGSALAVAFDLGSALGFTSATDIGANAYNVGSNLAPLFTGLGQNVRSLPGIPTPSTLQFPLQTAADETQRIEQSLDDRLRTPYSYSFNVSLGRDLGKGYSFEASYVGRVGRSLLSSRDMAHLNNLRDPKSGTDWYSAIRQLINLRERNTPINSVQQIPYFENLFPNASDAFGIPGSATQAIYTLIARRAVGGENVTDYTYLQSLLDDGMGFGNNLFFHPQYATFAAYSSIGTSDYHAAQFTLRRRFSSSFYFDLNYTLGHSIDITSGPEFGDPTDPAYLAGGSVFLVNPLDLKVNRANSDFDVRHLVNANFGYDLPFGKGKSLLGGAPGWLNALVGGWKLTGIFRWNSGLPSGEPFDDGRWATNWNVQSSGVQIRKVKATTAFDADGNPVLFRNVAEAYRSYRNAYPGEIGDRNVLRDPGFVSFDSGLMKSFSLPWEGSRIVFRWDTFNLTNSQRFTGVLSDNRRLGVDPYLGGTPSADFGKFTRIQGTPRVMQFALRVEF